MLRLLLPALIPSWRFFDRVGPSLRLDFAWVANEEGVAADWIAFHPEVASVPLHRVIPRLWWDPRGNESRYLMSCCERLLETGSAHAEREIRTAIAGSGSASSGGLPPGRDWLVFRVRRLERDGEELVESIAFQSKALRPGWA